MTALRRHLAGLVLSILVAGLLLRVALTRATVRTLE